MNAKNAQAARVKEWKRKNAARVRAQEKRAWERIKNTEKGRKIRLLEAARRRAREAGLEYNLRINAIHWPDKCPIYGTPLLYVGENRAPENMPSIDRIDSRRGYTLDNVQVISLLANTHKSNMTIEQMRQQLEYHEVMHS